MRNGIKEVPKEITLCNLECILMPNGEVLCNGRTVGWFGELAAYLMPKKPKTDEKK